MRWGSLAALLSDDLQTAEQQPLAKKSNQQVWTNPASGYVRRHVSPRGFASPIELVEVVIPLGDSVFFENVARTGVTHQQVWVLKGEMQVSVREKTWQRAPGDCLAMLLDQAHLL